MSISTLMDWSGNKTPIDQPETEPAYYNIPLYKSTSWIYSIEFLDADDDPINISGYTFTLTIKVSAFDLSIIKALTIGSGLSVGGEYNNILIINTIVDFNTGVYDLIGRAGDGEIIPFLKGKLKVEENV